MSASSYLIDTNVAIGYLDGQPIARELIRKHGAHPGNSAVSQITRIGLLSFHALGPDEEARIRVLLAAVAVITLDEDIERETIALRRRTRLKLPDAIIGASARVRGLTLLTFDDRLSAALAAPITPAPAPP